MAGNINANLEAALALAAAGIRIFPAGADKRPLISGWQEAATSDRDIIEDWWRRAPYALPAIPCGPNNLIVIDLDRHPGGPDGVVAFKRLVETHGGLPACPIVRTPNGGLHIYFAQPDGEPLGNGRGALPPGVDVRGIGGFVIAPGAVLPDGRGWTLVRGRPAVAKNTASALPDWPQQLIRKANGKGADTPDTDPSEVTSDERGRAYALQALHEIEIELAATAAGERNERLYKAAFRLGTMAGRSWLTEGEIIDALMRASESNNYLREHGSAATRKTIASGLADGEKKPHADLEDREEYQAEHEHSEKRNGERGNGKRDHKSAKAKQQHRQQRQRETGDWDEPDISLLDDRRGDLPGFPGEALGENWLDWLRRSAHGAGVTPSHVAVPMLAAASSLIGTSRRVQPSRSWSEPLTLWTAVIGFSGTGKTPGADVTLRALSMIDKNRKQANDALQSAHDLKAEAAKAARKKWEKEVHDAVENGLPPPPKPPEAMDVGKFITPRLFASNVTIERWATLLQARPSGMFMYRDELSGHFLNMSRYTSGQDNEFWLEAYNGKYYVVERQSAPAIVIPHLLIGLSGGFQPSKLARSFEGDDDGMYARVLFAWPVASAYQPLTDEVSEMEPELVNALTRLANLPCTDADGNFVSRTVPLSAAAREEFEHFRHFMHEGLPELDGREREWWAKGPTHVLRLSGTLGYLDWSWAGGAEPAEIEAQYVQSSALLWREYYWPHARAALRQVGLSERHINSRRALRWIRANGRQEVSREDLRRDALGQRLDAEQTQNLMDGLVKAGWLREITQKPGPMGGRAARRWEVNPKLFSIDTAETAETAETRAVHD
jgi:hypothetical protein